MSVNGVSIVIPAYNEEAILGDTLQRANQARARVSLPSEVVVVDNLSTDRTAEIAREHGAIVVSCEIRNISAVRNTGLQASKYDLIIAIDADCAMPPQTLTEVLSFMQKGTHIGGGLGLELRERELHKRFAIWLVQTVVERISGIHGAVFFFLRDEALKIGGFNESKLIAEDSAFAIAMQDHAKTLGKKFGLLKHVKISTFDRKQTSVVEFLKLLPKMWRAYRGQAVTQKELGYWYDPKR